MNNQLIYKFFIDFIYGRMNLSNNFLTYTCATDLEQPLKAQKRIKYNLFDSEGLNKRRMMRKTRGSRKYTGNHHDWLGQIGGGTVIIGFLVDRIFRSPLLYIEEFFFLTKKKKLDGPGVKKLVNRFFYFLRVPFTLGAVPLIRNGTMCLIIIFHHQGPQHGNNGRPSGLGH